MELGDDEVLVVAVVADPGLPVDPRQVALQVVVGRDPDAANGRIGVVALGGGGAHLELDPVVEVGRLGGGLAVEGRAVAVHRVQVQRRVAQVAQLLGDHRRLQRGQVGTGDVAELGVAVGVGGDVMVDELAPVGVHGRDGGVGQWLQRVGGRRGILDHGRPQRLQGRHHRRRVVVGQVLAGELGGQLGEQVVERGGVVDDLGLRHRRLQGGDAFVGRGQSSRLRRVVGKDMPAMADSGQDTSGSWLAVKPHLILPLSGVDQWR